MSVTEAKIRNTFDVAWAVVFVALMVFFLFLLIEGYDAADVRSVCSAHAGVQQVEDETWSGGLDRKALVVCRDGYAGGVR